MTLYEVKKAHLRELGLLEMYSLTEDYTSLHVLDQNKIISRIEELEPYIQLLCSIEVTGFQKTQAVTMYTADNKEIRIFQSLADAAAYIGDEKKASGIRRVVNYERKMYKGFQFRYVGSGMGFHESASLSHRNLNRPVEQLRQVPGGWMGLREFDNMAAAARYINPVNEQSGRNNISKCCHNKMKTYLGYGWKFKYQSKLNNE